MLTNEYYREYLLDVIEKQGEPGLNYWVALLSNNKRVTAYTGEPLGDNSYFDESNLNAAGSEDELVSVDSDYTLHNNNKDEELPFICQHYKVGG